MRNNVEVTVAQIVATLGGELVGSSDVCITSIAPLERATPSDISFLSSTKYARYLLTSHPACLILNFSERQLVLDKTNFQSIILTDDAYLYYARLSQWWKKQLVVNFQKKNDFSDTKIHSSAVISSSAVVAPDAEIGPLCVIEDGVVIGARTILKSRVTIHANCQIGDDCLIHSGVVIGADGFGFALDKTNHQWVKIEQLGAVVVKNHVEIGANSCIDRGALSNTVIEEGVKLDNLIQIGHNVHIGRHTAIAGCVGIAGSAVIGAHCTIGGGAVILGHLTLADHVHISAASVVTRSLDKAGQYTGLFPLDTNNNWEKNAVTLKQLHHLRRRIGILEKNI